MFVPDAVPLDMQIVGRTLLHAGLVGVAAGLIGAAFFAALELVQSVLLEGLAGYEPLRAFGEKIGTGTAHHSFRPWVLLFLPALGALVGSLIAGFAPETRGGGGDAMIRSFHHQGGVIRKRVIWVKSLASIFTLGTGGSGGREGPTMQVGGALGSFVGGVLRVTPAERRVLMIAGVAAGMSAVFRTPLGAAILAIEVLYRDDFEGEALIPAILASVISYSIVISIYGESTLFSHAPRYPFLPRQLPLYAVMAIMVALLAWAFETSLHKTRKLAGRLPVPEWARPAIGGLALGILAVPVIVLVSGRVGASGQGLGILGGGYGAAQVAVDSAAWMPAGWRAVELLLLLCFAKLLASSFTIGTGGSAGDFAPSLVLGAIFGGAFGRAAQLVFHDPSIQPGAFALVGMGTFYGGIAHVPISALIMVSELAGSYDLLVPLMLAEGIAFVALRHRSLYHAQVASRKDSPVHRAAAELDVLRRVRVGDILIRDRPYLSVQPSRPATDMLRAIAEVPWQDSFPVVNGDGRMQGLITADSLRMIGTQGDSAAWLLAADAMQPPVTVTELDDLRTAGHLMVTNALRELPVVAADGRILGFVDEADISRAFLDTGAAAPPGSGEH